jgi:hypothetical protein
MTAADDHDDERTPPQTRDDVAPPKRLGREPTRSPHHGHLWLLLDGTPAHAPPGELTYNDDGQLACHLCGQWFDHLGLHLRRHGWNAAEYRDAVGLTRHVPLCNSALSARASTRQHRIWNNDSTARERFAVGQDMARRGELAALAATVTRARKDAGLIPASVLAARDRRLAQGRATGAQRQQDRIATILAEQSAPDLATLLSQAYANGATLDSLAHLTGLHHRRIRVELVTAGIQVREPGQNRPTSKTRRAAIFNHRTAKHVGTRDITEWLTRRRAAGDSLRSLAELTGRSEPWIRSRLQTG